MPASADAASGDFLYRFTGLDGTPQYANLIDPASRECIALPEVADPGSSNPADSPWNYTDSTATVFTGPDCEGAFLTLRPSGGHASEQLKLRSVLFS